MATLVNDPRLEVLIAELSTKSQRDKNELLELIRIKKSKVGAGYLTDQGALFLVASDLDISINYDHEKPPSLSHLAPDQKSLTITTRILSIGVPRVFTRKSDSRKGLITRLFIYDNSTQTSAAVWDTAIGKIIDDKLDLRPGDLVTLSGLYTRQGLDGQPGINFGDDATVEKCGEDSTEVRIDKLEKRTYNVSSLENTGKSVSTRGKIKGEAKRSSFSRTDGTASDYVTFEIADEEDGKRIRTVIWNNSNPLFDKLREGATVTLLNVRTKLNAFQNNGEVEIHGDENTCILENFEETRKWMAELLSGYSSQGILPKKDENKKSGSLDVVPFIARVISKRKSDPSEGRSHMLVVDSQKRKISITLTKDAENSMETVSIDDVVLCRPETVDYSVSRANCVSPNSVTRVAAKRPDIPVSSSFFAKVEDLAENTIASLDLICLTDPLSREIQTKEGLVRRSEILVADHTGEIKLYAWRSLAKLLEGFAIGERIEVVAAEVQAYEGKKFLVLKNYSSMVKSTTVG